MITCGICGHPGVHAYIAPADGGRPKSCGSQCRLCIIADQENNAQDI